MTIKDKILIAVSCVGALLAFIGLQFITYELGIENPKPSLDKLVKYSTVSIYMNHGLASGFYVSKDGYIVTNYHVVKGSSRFIIVNYDQSEADAKLVGVDMLGDLAVLKVEPNDKILPIKWGDSGFLNYGDAVFAIGNPFGNEFTVTRGIVSNSDRHQGASPYSYIQLDAAMNPGNSGGPVVNEKNEVIAVSEAISTQLDKKDAQGAGIGYAIPSDYARNIVKEIIAGNKEVKHSAIRIAYSPNFNDVTPNYHVPDGVTIDQTVPNGAAEVAGLEPGDVVTKVNGKIIQTDTFAIEIMKAKIGDILTLSVKRAPSYTKGRYENLEIKVKTEEFPEPNSDE